MNSDTPQPDGPYTPQPWPYTEGTPPGYGQYPSYPQYQPPAWDQPDRPFPGFWMALLLCLLFLLVTQVPGAILGAVLLVVFMLLKPGQFQNPDPAALLATPEASLAMGVAFAVTEALVIGFSVLVLWFVLGRDWPRKVALRWPGWSVTLFALASVPAFVFIANLFAGWLAQLVPSAKDGQPQLMEEMVKLFHSWPLAFGILVVGFGPGIGEELWCRAFLGRGLVGRYGVWVGVLATSFFFGAIHIEPVQGTMAMGMGLWLHYVYLTARSLWMPILLHTVNNSLAILAGHLAPLQHLDEATAALTKSLPPSELFWPTVTAFALLGAVAVALYQARTRLVATGDQPPWEPACPAVECPPADSGTRVVQGRASLLAVVAVLLAFAACVASLVRLVQAR